MKKMKFKKIYPYLDDVYDIRVWAADKVDDDFKIVYEGPLWEMPKKYKKYYLIKAKDNGDSPAIASVNWSNKDSWKKGFLSFDENKLKGAGFRVTLVKNY